MMHDDPKENENFDEDFDLLDDEDLEALDESLDDENWDEDLDADLDGDLEDLDDEFGDDDGASLADPSQKTFAQKYFMLIVLGVIVCFGGLIYLAMSGGSAPSKPASSAQQKITEARNTQPPQPTPIKTEPRNNDVLTPLPTEETLETANLDEFDFSEIEELDGLDNFEDAALFDSEISSNNPDPAPAPIQNDRDVTVSTPVAEPQPVQEKKSEKEESPTQNIAIEQNNAQNTASAKDEELYARVYNIENALGENEQKMDQILSALQKLQNDIGALSRTQNSLKTDLDRVSKQAASSKKPAQKKSVETKSVSRPVTKKPTTKPKVKAAAKWILRAAQPGKAVVSKHNSNDFKTVHVGDTLEGIGQILSIGFKDGKWVVQGTKSAVRQ